MFFNDILPWVKSAVDEIKEVRTAYQSLVAECRKEFGSSVAEQQSKRKRKRNLQKELKGTVSRPSMRDDVLDQVTDFSSVRHLEFGL